MAFSGFDGPWPSVIAWTRSGPRGGI